MGRNFPLEVTSDLRYTVFRQVGETEMTDQPIPRAADLAVSKAVRPRERDFDGRLMPIHPQDKAPRPPPPWVLNPNWHDRRKKPK